MDRIQAQFAKLTQLLFDPKTSETYKSALVLTWNILKETALLLWLLLCSIFVLAAWIGDHAVRLGRDFRSWINQQSTSEADSSETMAATGQAILEAGTNGANFLLDQAREQLGLEKPARPEKTAAPKTAKTTPAPKAPAAAATPKVAKAPPVVAVKTESAAPTPGATMATETKTEEVV